MKKKIIICVIILVLAIAVVLIMLSKANIKGTDKKMIGETDITKKSYGYPIISLLTYNNKKIKIEAGYYRYGDVNLDGVVDDQDIEEIDTMINTQLSYTKEQRLLADVDESGKVNSKDISVFKTYFKKNGAVKYDLRKDTLEYCLTTANNSSTCVWKKTNEFEASEIRDYYGFVRQKNTLVISESQKFSKEGMNEIDKREI